MNIVRIKQVFSILFVGLVYGASVAWLAWLPEWTSVRVPAWVSAILFWAGILAVIYCGFRLRRSHPVLSRAWVTLAVAAAVALVYLFPQALAPGCGGAPRALAGWQTVCHDVCVDECTWWVPKGDPLCPAPPNPWDLGCCLAYSEVCHEECETVWVDEPPTVGAAVGCSLSFVNGWCPGDAALVIQAADPQGYAIQISGDRAGEAFFCTSSPCVIPLPDGSGTVNYTAIAADSGLTASGSTGWQRDSIPPQIDGSLSGTLAGSGWYLSPVTVSASAADPTPGSGLAAFEYSLDGLRRRPVAP